MTHTATLTPHPEDLSLVLKTFELGGSAPKPALPPNITCVCEVGMSPKDSLLIMLDPKPADVVANANLPVTLNPKQMLADPMVNMGRDKGVKSYRTDSTHSLMTYGGHDDHIYPVLTQLNSMG